MIKKFLYFTSGIRLGTPAVTTRGLKEEDMIDLAEAIDLVLKKENTPENIAKAKEIVQKLTLKYIK